MLLARSVSAELSEKTEFPRVNGGTAPVALVEAIESASSSDHRELGVGDRKTGMCRNANMWATSQSMRDTWSSPDDGSPNHSNSCYYGQSRLILQFSRQLSTTCNNFKGNNTTSPVEIRLTSTTRPTEMIDNGEISETPHLIVVQVGPGCSPIHCLKPIRQFV